MLINDYKKLLVKGITIPTKTIYRIVNEFFIYACKNKSVPFPAIQTWWANNKKFDDFAVYAYVARRYGFSVVKKRKNAWYENGKKILEIDENGNYKILIEL